MSDKENLNKYEQILEEEKEVNPQDPCDPSHPDYPWVPCGLDSKNKKANK
ncbi:hypothetical protein [Clostridium sp. Ade.TY]|nr:hypothetical protein [Clostridium sp. Ade.TY]